MSQEDDVYIAFRGRHRDIQIAGLPQLFSLDPRLIEAIDRTIPNLFSPSALRFEQDLARTASLGFFGGIPFGTSAHDDKEWARIMDLMDDLNKLMSGREKPGKAHRKAEAARLRDRIKDKSTLMSVAYVGWLVTNPLYRNEVADLRRTAGDAVARQGCFPHQGYWLIGEPTYEHFTRAQLNLFGHFYSRWGLERLITWDYPLPVMPAFEFITRDDVRSLESAGRVIFLPWYVFSDRSYRLDMNEVMEMSRAGAPNHLGGWFDSMGAKARRADGYRSYARLHYLYRNVELGLKARYGSALSGSILKIDDAVASIWKVSSETPRKLRGRLGKAITIGPAEEASAT